MDRHGCSLLDVNACTCRPARPAPPHPLLLLRTFQASVMTASKGATYSALISS